MKTHQFGFGAMQMLLVMAAVAVTSFIAVPKYQEAAQTTKLTAAVDLAAESRAKISQAFMVNNSLPRTAREAARIASVSGVKPDYVRNLKIQHDAGGEKVIIMVYLNDGVAENILGGEQYIYMAGFKSRRDHYNLEWQCGAVNVDFNMLPENCQG